MSRTLFQAVCVAAFVLAAAPRPTDACSRVFPCTNDSSPRHEGALPASVPAIVVRHDIRQRATPPTLSRSRDGAEIPVQVTEPAEGTWLLQPESPLEIGERYSFEQPAGCGDFPSTVTFEATEAKPLPETPGTLRAGAPTEGRIGWGKTSGDCSSEFVATTVDVPLVLEPSDEVRALLDHVRFLVEVDGEPWAATEFGRHEDQTALPKLRAACGGDPADGFSLLSEGKHHVEVRVQVAGLDPQPAAATLDVELACEDVTGCGTAQVGALGVLALGLAMRRRRAR